MASTPAQMAKEKGNATFKTGDYPVAIGHYTAAILADPKDHTFPLNRAAAYLKLGKNADAERDCSTVIRLNATNAKAYFRRGQARVGLAKLAEAQGDLKEALKLEPGNKSVREELSKVEALIDKARPAPRKQPSDTIVPSNLVSASTVTRRRRVPITIIEPPPQTSLSSPSTSHALTGNPSAPSSGTPPDDFMKPVVTRKLSGSLSTSPDISSLQTKPATFKEAKQARETIKPSRVGAGGGIFRPSGQHTIFPSNLSEDSRPASLRTTEKSVPDPPVKPTPPKTSVPAKSPVSLFTFTRNWEAQRSAKDRWAFLSNIPPTSLPSLFQTSLEPTLLVSMLETFLAVLREQPLPDAPDVRDRMKDYMINLGRVPRFGTVLLLMSRDEKELASELWQELGTASAAPWGIVS